MPLHPPQDPISSNTAPGPTHSSQVTTAPRTRTPSKTILQVSTQLSLLHGGRWSIHSTLPFSDLSFSPYPTWIPWPKNRSSRRGFMSNLIF